MIHFVMFYDCENGFTVEREMYAFFYLGILLKNSSQNRTKLFSVYQPAVPATYTYKPHKFAYKIHALFVVSFDGPVRFGRTLHKEKIYSLRVRKFVMFLCTYLRL